LRYPVTESSRPDERVGAPGRIENEVPFRRRALAALTLVALTAVLSFCESERHQLMREAFPTYPENVRRAIVHSYLLFGMTYEQVFLTLGLPICKREDVFEGRAVEVWLYPPGGRDPCQTARHRVYFEKGIVVGWESRAR